MAHVEGRPHSTPDEHTTGEEDAVQMDAGKKVKKIVTRFVGKTNRAVRFNVQRIKKRLPSIEIEEHMKRIDEGVKRTNERFKRRLRKQTFRTRDSDIYKMDNPHGEGLSSLFQPAALSLISDDDEIMEIMEDEIMDDDDPTMLAENEDFSENEGFFQQCRDKLHQISRWCHDEQQREMLRSWAINFLLLENASFLLLFAGAAAWVPEDESVIQNIQALSVQGMAWTPIMLKAVILNQRAYELTRQRVNQLMKAINVNVIQRTKSWLASSPLWEQCSRYATLVGVPMIHPWLMPPLVVVAIILIYSCFLKIISEMRQQARRHKESRVKEAPDVWVVVLHEFDPRPSNKLLHDLVDGVLGSPPPLRPVIGSSISFSPEIEGHSVPPTSPFKQISEPQIRDGRLGHTYNIAPQWFKEADASSFQVRGANYLEDRIKLPSAESLLEFICCDLIISEGPLRQVSRRMTLPEIPQTDDDVPPLFCFNYNLPKDKPAALIGVDKNPLKMLNIVAWFRLTPATEAALRLPESECPPSVRLLRRWCRDAQHDDILKGQLKCIGRHSEMPDMPGIIQGLDSRINCKPVLMSVGGFGFARRGVADIYRGDGFMEIGVDISAHCSFVAQKCVIYLWDYIGTTTMDLVFLIEGRSEDELPECIFGCLRVDHLAMKKLQTEDELFGIGVEANEQSTAAQSPQSTK